jgi:hypothetical protein
MFVFPSLPSSQAPASRVAKFRLRTDLGATAHTRGQVGKTSWQRPEGEAEQAAINVDAAFYGDCSVGFIPQLTWAPADDAAL